jgi:hypothetical protein
MTTTEKMIEFLPWVQNILIPEVINHPDANQNANYKNSYSDTFTHIPFVLERLIPSYFLDSHFFYNKVI